MSAEVRFIEYMDVGGATHWSMDRVVSRARDARSAGSALRADRRRSSRASSAPADRYRLPDGTVVRHHLVDDASRSARTAIAAG